MTRLPDGTLETTLLAEEAVIAACLLDDDAYGRVATIVSSGDFFRDSNRMMFAAIAKLARAANPPGEQSQITTITLAYELELRGQLDDVGAEPGIQEIVGRWFTAIGVEAHARIVKQASERRQLLHQASKMAAAAGRGDIEGAREIAQESARGWWEKYEESPR